jgi:hypothetical protein
MQNNYFAQLYKRSDGHSLSYRQGVHTCGPKAFVDKPITLANHAHVFRKIMWKMNKRHKFSFSR